MKKTLLLLVLGTCMGIVNAQNVWTNEFHYDNIGTDTGEFIEVVLENAGNYNLADFAVTLYNGNSGASYDSKTLDLFTMGAVEGNFTIYYYDFPSNGIQNGPEDGIALSYQGALISGQFLSYEGVLTATDGPASGQTSTDIGVAEISVDPGYSLQLSGTGEQYDEFVWEEPAAETKGALNNNQELGGYVPDPEPSNYPTEFTATAVDMDIRLDWTDAVGDVLPSGYLILGEENPTASRAFTPPVDGVPVDDDLNWADGNIAVNVPYGEETFSLGVNSNAMYHFVIYSYTNAGVNIDYKTDGTPPEASSLSNNYIILNQNIFALDLGNWTPYSVTGAQGWVHDPDHGVPPGCAKISGYDGGSNENEDWLISPNIGMTDIYEVKMDFLSAYNYAGPALQLMVSNDYDGSGNPNDFTWTDISQEAVWSDGSWVWTESGTIDISSYYNAICYLAFRYTSTTSESSTWELDDIIVFGFSSVGTPEESISNIKLFPNPATSQVSLVSRSGGSFKIINFSGQTIKEGKIQAGNNSISVNDFEPGLYFIRTSDQQKNVTVNKLIIR